ncbi:DUF2326 domain-containing protein [Gardnerella vaginalis]|uniref:DUF2326 domain-containing protein n=1 Tax=Gardnerella vaginalis TaxID=2702 RepID=UPI00254F96DF|nr:DUF2326 domain-containing protein [Gardnerella vaginalis]MDK7259401.1 DUF2326 domain-containing protein [Gardnerella vaginalis]MDK8776158.1 DUF2326 domain-containing protein [Gardnerella vaginalis]
MLTELYCDKFKESAPQPIRFNSGLNVVLGTEGATNSIGKSTFLMILDFVFGGDDYLNLSKDVKTHIGDHSFSFAFNFNGKKHYYIRGTKDHNEVLVCNENYQPLNSMSIRDYREMLSHAYKIDSIGISWRDAVSPTFRIWQRDNDKPTLPLSRHRTDTHRSGIIRLLALFDMLIPVKNALENEENAKNALAAAKTASSVYQLNIASSKNDFENNTKRIQELEEQLKEVQNSFGEKLPSELTEEQAKIVAELKREQTPIYRQRTILTNRLNALINNHAIGSERFNKADFEQLKEFVPELDIDYLTKIEGFHAGIKKLLTKQVTDEIKATKEKLTIVNDRLNHLDEQIINITTAPSITAATAQTYHELKTEISSLQNANKNYLVKEENRETLKKTQGIVEETTKNLLNQIEKSINNYLKKVDESFTDEKRNPPKLSLKNIDSYSYAIADDTGTGSGYRSLLSFDLALLEHSKLPVIMEDSFLFKQIETEAVNRILAHYNTIKNKQIFIALDEIDKYNGNAKEIIKNSRCLRLDSNAEALFGKEWGKK